MLNQEQKEAVAHIEGRLRIIAGPGTGKTRVLTERVAHMVQSGRDPQSILAVTFTRKAAREIRERLEGRLGAKVADQVTCSTLHSFARAVVDDHKELLGLRRVTIARSSDVSKLLKPYMEEGEKVLEYTRLLSRIKRSGRAVEGVGAAFEDWARTHPKDLSRIRVLASYEKDKGAAELLDFDDLTIYAARLMRMEGVADAITARWCDISVDEYQDTDAMQHEIVSALAGGRNLRSLMIVGDPNQSIYGFRGAKPAVLEDAEDEIGAMDTIVLHENYRSTPEILDAVRAVLDPAVLERVSNLRPNQAGGGSVPQVVEYSDPIDEADGVANAISKLIRSGVSPSEIAVLYRWRRSQGLLDRRMQELRIPYEVAGGVRFAEKPEVRVTLDVLRAAVDQTDRRAMEVALGHVSGFGAKTVASIVEAAEAAGIGVREVIEQEAAGRGAKLRKRDQAGLDFLAVLDSIVCKLDEEGLWSAVQVALAFLPPVPDRDVDAQDKRDGIVRGFNNICADLERRVVFPSGQGLTHDVHGAADSEAPGRYGGKDVRLGWLLHYPGDPSPARVFLEDLALEADENEGVVIPRVTLSTIHAAKGREFEHVFVIGLVSNPESSGESEWKAAEEQRLVFVALSRAKKGLTASMFRRHIGQRDNYDLALDPYVQMAVDAGTMKLTQGIRAARVSRW